MACRCHRWRRALDPYISKVKAKKSKRGYLFMPYLSVSNSNYELIAKVREIIGRGYVGRREEKE